jgi:dihydroorotase
VRSALSALLSLGYKDSLGEHPLIKRFMKGVFNQRPALPRYQHIWDVNIVLEYLASLSPVNVLSFYTLTLNFVTLLCLLSGQRVQTLQQICLEDCAVTDGVLRIKHSNFKDHKTRKSRR